MYRIFSTIIIVVDLLGFLYGCFIVYASQPKNKLWIVIFTLAVLNISYYYFVRKKHLKS